jgi:hypothetical protein
MRRRRPSARRLLRTARMILNLDFGRDEHHPCTGESVRIRRISEWLGEVVESTKCDRCLDVPRFRARDIVLTLPGADQGNPDAIVVIRRSCN